MTERADARPEDAFRRANDELASTYRLLVPTGLAPLELSPFICECSDTRCTRVVQLSLEEYAAVRERPDGFVVVPGHVVDHGAVVAEETDRYVVLVRDGARELTNSY